jgi:hypothetical protein
VTDELEREDAQGEMREKGWIALATNDRHEDVVNRRQQQGVEY